MSHFGDRNNSKDTLSSDRDTLENKIYEHCMYVWFFSSLSMILYVIVLMYLYFWWVGLFFSFVVVFFIKTTKEWINNNVISRLRRN